MTGTEEEEYRHSTLSDIYTTPIRSLPTGEFKTSKRFWWSGKKPGASKGIDCV